MKKNVILFAGSLLLAGCSAPAAAPAESPSAAATPSAAASSAAAEATPSAAAPESAPAAAPVAASGARMTNEETCTELLNALDPENPDGGTDAGREALAASMRTLPDRASEDLKDVMPTLAKMVTVMHDDAKNNTDELDTFLSDPVVSAEYDKAGELISMFCFPEATEEEVVEEEAVEEEVIEQEVVEPEAAE